jgi:hypothetical protein
LRALRANHVFGTDEKHIRTENMVIDKSKAVLGSHLSKIAIAHQCAFHPCTFDDPRGRLPVRTTSRSAKEQPVSMTPILAYRH